MDLKDLILSLLVFSPLLLVWVFGIVFAVSRWNNHPKVSKLVVIASILIFVHFAASQFWNAWIVPQLIHSDLRDHLSFVLGAWHIASVIISAIVWTLLLRAAFLYRR